MYRLSRLFRAIAGSGNSFVTLTYSQEHIPVAGSLDYRDFQLFMKRLRKHAVSKWRVPLFYPRPRFYMCGEYGERTKRPHYHACLFGFGFDDLVRLGGSDQYPIFTSETLDSLWQKGHCSVGEVTFESAAYVARYVMKKVTGTKAERHYLRLDGSTGELVPVQPEFNKMSLKPGIGSDWFDRYKDEVLVRDGVIVRGRVTRTPRYYDKLLEKIDPIKLEDLQFDRYIKNVEFLGDQTTDRLLARELVTRGRLKFKTRSLE